METFFQAKNVRMRKSIKETLNTRSSHKAFHYKHQAED